ncbi:hypothetical protein ABZ659_22215, partial [Streptomyces sp. NPDC006997]
MTENTRNQTVVQDRTLVVTGATGRTGRRVVEAARATGWRVREASRTRGCTRYAASAPRRVSAQLSGASQSNPRVQIG